MDLRRTIFSNIRVFDGTGSDVFDAEVSVRGNRIEAIARNGSRLPREDAAVIDGRNGTLIPGLIEPHAHLGFAGTVDRPLVWRDLTHEQHLLATAEAGKTMLDFGFTGAYSGGAADARWEVALREEFAEGWLPGPRLRACSFERNASATRPTASRYGGVAERAPDVEAVRAFVNEMADLEVDSVKFVVTGESAVHPGTSRKLQFYEEELVAAGEVARQRNVWLNGHCHSAESIKLALKANFRVLYHCTWADEEAIDMLEARKDKVFVSPAPGVNFAAIYEASDFGISREKAIEMEQVETLEQVSKVMPELLRRGVRVLPGGDYGFAWNPIGRNARDMQLFVDYFHFTPAQALRAATQYGGQIMGMGAELGLIREGYLADLVLVDGNPLENLRLLQKRERLAAIMKDGKFHKRPINSYELP